MINSRVMQCGLLLLSLVLSNPSHAQSTVLPVGSQGKHLGDITLPSHGQTQANVKAQFGQAIASQGPSGKPPISRWDYPGFSVYFENDTVIHSVKKHRRQELPLANDSHAP